MKIYADFNFIVLTLNGQKPEFLFLNSIHIKYLDNMRNSIYKASLLLAK